MRGKPMRLAFCAVVLASLAGCAPLEDILESFEREKITRELDEIERVQVCDVLRWPLERPAYCK